MNAVVQGLVVRSVIPFVRVARDAVRCLAWLEAFARHALTSWWGMTVTNDRVENPSRTSSRTPTDVLPDLRAIADFPWKGVMPVEQRNLIRAAADEIERLRKVEGAAREVIEEYTPKREAANSIYRLSEVLHGR